MQKKFFHYDELELTNLVRQGDKQAFEELFCRYQGKVYLYVLKFARDKDIAEELTQDIFIKLWEYTDQLDPLRGFSAMLFTIAKNTVLNHVRNNARSTAFKKDYEATADRLHNPIENEVYWNEYQSITRRLVDLLPPQRKSIFVLSRYEGKSYDEIADQLGISKDTVRLQIIKSLKSIRKQLIPHVTTLTTLLIIYF